MELFEADCIVQYNRQHLFIFKPSLGTLVRKALDFGRRDFRNKLASVLLSSLKQSDDIAGTIIIPCDIYNYINAYLSEYPFMKIKTSEIKMHFELLIPSKQNPVNLYETWNTSAYTSFCRLALILKGASIKREVAEKMDGCWKYLKDDEWIDVENMIRDIVLDEYSRNRFISKDLLTQSDLRDIVFGIDVYKSRKILIGRDLISGEENVDKEIKSEVLLSDWKNSFIYYEENIDKTIQNLIYNTEKKSRSSGNKKPTKNVIENSFLIPRNILETLVRISDLQRPLFLLGLENYRYALLPQYSTYNLIYTTNIKSDLRKRAKVLVLLNGTSEIYKKLCLKLSLGDFPCIFIDTRSTPNITECEGVFLIPKLWNYTFCKEKLTDNYELSMGVPYKFFDEECRISHFEDFYNKRK